MPVVLYAGYMMLATATCLFSSVASFSTVMDAPSCVFHIGDASFQTQYSHSFWLAQATGKMTLILIFIVIRTDRSPPFSGLLCAVMGLLVLTLNCVMPEKMREAFSVGGLEEEDGEDYLSSLLLDGVTTSPVASKGGEVSWGHLGCQ